MIINVLLYDFSVFHSLVSESKDVKGCVCVMCGVGSHWAQLVLPTQRCHVRQYRRLWMMLVYRLIV